MDGLKIRVRTTDGNDANYSLRPRVIVEFEQKYQDREREKLNKKIEVMKRFRDKYPQGLQKTIFEINCQ